jgi:transcriptional regulator GlxA family with amidase domain
MNTRGLKTEAGASVMPLQPTGGTTPSCRTGSLAAEAAKLIHERLAEVHSVEQVSSILGVSREHLSRSFKKYLGCSVWAFMTALRVERSKQLLGGPKLVKQIAKEVGFGSDSSFGRAFARSVGVRPAQFRRNLRANALAGDDTSSTDCRRSQGSTAR